MGIGEPGAILPIPFLADTIYICYRSQSFFQPISILIFNLIKSVLEYEEWGFWPDLMFRYYHLLTAIRSVFSTGLNTFSF